MNIQKLLTLALILLISLEVKCIKNQILTICEEIQTKLNQENKKIKQLTNQMNELIVFGQVDLKAATKFKNQQVIELSSRVEQTAKTIQKIYDNQEFMKFCIILHEEQRYKELTAQQLQKGYSQLNQLQKQLKGTKSHIQQNQASDL